MDKMHRQSKVTSYYLILMDNQNAILDGYSATRIIK